jgi:ATP-dependent Clp protease adaptor protein ClpS
MSTDVIEKTDTTTVTRTCPMYKVIMHNDDVTSMEFVTQILVTIFNKEIYDAVKIMLEIHTKGCGLAGIYALEHAEMKVDQTHSLARTQKFPLTCTIEPA